jgi:hypothetical protein
MIVYEPEYKISLYRPDFEHQVVDLLHYLWGNDFDNNLNYFRWKYDDNPYVKAPLGIVALKDGKSVGFRGYFATKWHICEKDFEILVLCPGDTCVHPAKEVIGFDGKFGDGRVCSRTQDIFQLQRYRKIRTWLFKNGICSPAD